MSRSSFRGLRSGLVFLVVLVIGTGVAQAGPPLICHPVDIGDADSLPTITSGWQVWKAKYDVRSLVDDTLSLLGPSTPVLVRMETIRRATVHGKKDPRVLEKLLAALETRVREAKESGWNDSLALFDLGYFIEALNQYSWMLKTHLEGMGRSGYALVEQAIEASGGDPEMEFAAALISVHPKRPRSEQHLRAAVDGAREGSLLADNLVTHFGERGTTLDDLRTRIASKR